MSKPIGRPNSGKYDNIVEDIKEYTENTEYPILKEICYMKHYNYDYVMQLQRGNENLSQSIKELLCKKESYLERNGLMRTIDNKMAIFTLKQLGWRDQVEAKVETTVDNITPLIEMLKENNNKDV